MLQTEDKNLMFALSGFLWERNSQRGRKSAARGGEPKIRGWRGNGRKMDRKGQRKKDLKETTRKYS